MTREKRAAGCAGKETPATLEFTRGSDTNAVKKAELAETVAELITDRFDLGWEQRQRLLDRLSNSRLDDLIEFVRAVHFEMAAIPGEACRLPERRCTPQRSPAITARATSSPPASCGWSTSGRTRRAWPPNFTATCSSPATDISDRVQLVPFVGGGPRRFLTLFTMPALKDKASGKVLEPERTTAMPRIPLKAPEFVGEILPYPKREERALQLLIDVQETKGPAFVDD